MNIGLHKDVLPNIYIYYIAQCVKQHNEH